MSQPGGILGGPAPRIFSLAPSASFLDALASGLIDATNAHDDPAVLADTTIFVPNRRSARELGLAFYNALGKGLITPNIRTLGDVDESDGADSFGPEALELPPAVSPPRRRGALARLIQGWRKALHGDELPPASALAAADELAALLDQSAVSEDVDWSKLDDVELEANLAAHWQVSASFLKIVSEAWPNWLAEQGAMDGLARRRAAAKALADRWSAEPPDHPVIIAGSTGATAATRILMRAVMSLPQGVILLPGLDPDLDGASWKAIARAPSHPQFAFSRALRDLRIAPSQVQLWPSIEETANQRARRRLINEALAPAETTSGWTKRLEHLAQPGDPKSLVEQAIAGMRLVEAEDETDEALIAALLLRETLETPGMTAALVAPDGALGRRVGAILERWGLNISPSAGAPLHRTQSGGFLLILMRWAGDPSDPVQLLAMLKHSFTTLGRDRATLSAIVSAFEIVAMRGPRVWSDLAGLATHIEKQIKTKTASHLVPRLEQGAALVREIAAIHAPFAAAFSGERVEGEAASEACAQLAMALARTDSSPEGDHIWAGREGAQAAAFLEQLAAVCAEMGGVQADFWPQFAEAVAQGMMAAPDTAEHPRIAIWGPLEARLQRRDRIILAGLNEGSWPRQPGADGFLNRKLRREMGFADADERIGLAAHDFEQLANARDVILLRAKRVEDKPAVASRWLWRLRTLSAGGLGSRAAADAALASAPDANPARWASVLRDPGKVESAAPPAPRPPVEARGLKQFSPSRVANLIRDPYADYARRILRLEALRRVGEDIDARLRGVAVHGAIEDYERSGGKLELDTLIVDKLVEAGASPEIIELERPLWLRAALTYLAWIEARAPNRKRFELERKAKISFPSQAPDGETTLGATADRVEELRDGTLAVIDFKTGRAKTKKEVQTGLEPQLSLEAYIASRNGFGDIPAAPVSQLIYFQFSTGAGVLEKKNGAPLELDMSVTEVANAAFAGLQRMISNYADEDQAYRSKPRAQFTWDFGDYDRLARRKEWTSDEGGEE